MRLLLAVLLLCTALAPPARAAETAELPWRPFTPALFAQARAEGKPVFLYLEAVWCHWCHVMQRQTFPDAGVQARLRQNWLIARVDHDADPLLANRYRDYGWPALIFFNAQGQEVVKRAGFLWPEDFARLLDAIVADPTPEQPEPGQTARAPPVTRLPEELAQQLIAAHQAAYDSRLGGLKATQKFLDRDSLEYALQRAAAGDKTEARRARQTLNAANALIDPVWGGMYQYSTHGDWRHPHFEKIMRTQAGALRLYALAYAQTGQARDLKAARAIRDYLLGFLRDPATGAFHGSQDADAVPGEKATAYFALDDAARRRIGLPRIAPQLYAQENGLAIEALARLAMASNDELALSAARRAADWALANRAEADGGFRHDERGNAGRYLGDSLHMGRALLALHQATGEARWLAAAARSGAAIAAQFAAEDGGYLTARAENSPVAPPRVTEENIHSARFFAQLARATGDAGMLANARHALRWLAQPSVAGATLTEPGILLAAADIAAAEQSLAAADQHAP